MDKNSTQILLERYFENELTGEEQTAFNRRLEEDAAFAKAFHAEKELMDGIEAFGNEQLRKQLEHIYLEETGQVPVPENAEAPKIHDPFEVPPIEDGKVVKMNRRKWWLAAAVLLIGLLARWVAGDRRPSPTQLYAIYAVHDFDLTEMGEQEELLPKVEQLLKKKQYAEALPLLDTYLEKNADNQQVVMARGKTLLELGRVKEALEVFEGVGTANVFYANEAKWYTALAYLKNGQIVECKAVLTSMPEDAVQMKEVKKLLRFLK